MTKSPSDPDQRNPSETVRLRDEALKRMLKTPPKKHADDKKPRAKRPERRGPLDPWKPR